MSKPRLTYFNISGNRGEECRLALHIAGIDFEDDRVDGPTFAERKPQLPFGSLPVLEIPGKGVLAHTNGILRFIGKAHDMYPSDSWQAARHDALMGAAEDLRTRFSMTMRLDSDEAKKAAREQICRDYAPQWARQVQAQWSEGPFVEGSKLSVVDLKLYMMVRWIEKGILDHVPSDLLAGHERLQKLTRAVAQHPRVVDWYAHHPA